MRSFISVLFVIVVFLPIGRARTRGPIPGATYIAARAPDVSISVNQDACGNSPGSQDCQQGVVQKGSTSILTNQKTMSSGLSGAIGDVVRVDTPGDRIAPVTNNLNAIAAALNGQPSGGYSSVDANLDSANQLITAVSASLADLAAELGTSIPQKTDESAQEAGRMQDKLQKMTRAFQTSVSGFLANQTNLQKADLTTTFTSFSKLLESQKSLFASDLVNLDSELAATQAAFKTFSTGGTKSVADIKTIVQAIQKKFNSFGTTGSKAIDAEALVLRNSGQRKVAQLLADAQQRLKATADAASVNATMTVADALAKASSQSALLAAADSSLTAAVLANISALQSKTEDALRFITDQAAQVADNATRSIAALADAQKVSQVAVAGKLDSLGKAVDSYTTQIKGSSDKATGSRISLLKKVNDMLSEVRAVASNSAAGFASAAGSSLNNQAGQLAQAQDAFASSISDGKKAILSEANSQREAVGEHSSLVYKTLADLLLQLHDLGELMKAKVGSKADAVDNSMQALNSVLSGSSLDLADAVESIAAQQRAGTADAASILLDRGLDATLAGQAAVAAQATAADQQHSQAQKVLEDLRAQSASAVEDAGAGIRDAAAAAGFASDAAASSAAAAERSKTNLAATLAGVNATVSGVVSAADSAVLIVGRQLADFLAREKNKTMSDAKLEFVKLNGTQAQIFDAVQTYLVGSSSDLISLLAHLWNDVNGTVDSLAVRSAQAEAVTLAATELEGRTVGGFQRSLAEFKQRIANTTAANAEATRTEAQQVIQKAMEDLGKRFSSVTLEAKSELEDAENVTAASADAAAQVASELATQSVAINGVMSEISQMRNESEVGGAALDAVLDRVLLRLQNKTANLNDAISNATATLAASETSAMHAISGINATTLTHLTGLVENATNTVTVEDADKLRDFVGELFGALDQQSNIQRDALVKQSGWRQSTSKALAAEVAEMKKRLDMRVIDLERLTGTSGQTVTDVLSKIGAALDAALNGTANEAVTAKLRSLRDVTAALNHSFGGFAASSADRLARRAQQSASAFVGRAALAINQHSLQVDGLGNQVLGLLSGIGSEAAANGRGLAGSKSAALKVASLLDDLGADAKQELAELLGKIQRGEITVQDAIGTASKLDIANLKTMADIANAFLLVIQGHESRVSQLIGDAEDSLLTYNDTLPGLFTTARVVHAAATQPLVEVEQRTRVRAKNVTEMLAAAVTTGQAQLKALEAVERADQLAVSGNQSTIEALLLNATTRINSIVDAERTAIRGIKDAAEVRVRSLIEKFKREKGLA